MKKVLSSVLLITMAAVIFAGCKGSASNLGPKEVLAAFFEKIAKKDLDGAAKLATKDSKSALDMMKKGLEMADKMKGTSEAAEKDPTEEFKDLEIGEAKINGDVATVPMRNKKKNEQMEFPVKKEDGEWKVDFSMATLMKMGMEQQNKRSMSNESGDNLDNVDSLDIQKGLQMADSALKAIDPEKLKELQETMEKLKKP